MPLSAFSNLAVDMIYAVIDLRVRAAAGGEVNLKNSTGHGLL
jgi:hypothetical protein